MNQYAIVETDAGFTIIEIEAGDDPVAVAESNRGQLVDAGLFTSYEDALDSLSDLEDEVEDYE